MKTFKFKTYLTSNVESLETINKELLNKCKQQHYKKGNYLLREGEISKTSYFVEDGLLRQFSVDDKGKEHVIQFAPENWFMANREGECFNLPSSYNIEAIEDTTVFIIEKELIESLSKTSLVFLNFNIELLHKHIASLQKRITQLQSKTAKERYLDFIKTYPDVLMRVPQSYVASYLGITPESLSRVRKEISVSK
jgi:CRP-like cAMP-binding protein